MAEQNARQRTKLLPSNRISFSSSNQLATKFNQQFNTSKLGRHTSSRETQVVMRETIGDSFTADLVMKAIKSYRNSKAFGPRQAQHLGPRFYSQSFHIQKPGKDTSKELLTGQSCYISTNISSLLKTTSALLQLTTDIAVGFNQRKPPDRTVYVAVDLLASFLTVCHNNREECGARWSASAYKC